MKKSMLTILFSLFISLTFSSFPKEAAVGPAKRIDLISKLSRPTRSLPAIPDIEAYVKDGVVTIHFNEAVAQDITVSLASNGEELYRETIQVNSPMVLPVFIDINEDDACQLEIRTDNWVLTGEW